MILAEDLDKILNDIEADKFARQQEEKKLGKDLQADENALSRAEEERRSKVAGFKLDLNLDEDFGEHNPENSAAPTHEEAKETEPEPAADEQDGLADTSEVPESEPIVENPDISIGSTGTPEMAEPVKKAGKKKKKSSRMSKTSWGCVRGIIYAVLVLGISGTLAYFAITGGIDITGLNKSSATVDVVIPEGASTEAVAKILKEKGLIDQPMIFRLYAKLTKADTSFQPGMFTLSPDMGYEGLIEKLQSAQARSTVKVLIPEGTTIDGIAKILKKEGVCETSAFYDALVNGSYDEDYDFLKQVPDKKNGKFEEPYVGRVYRLEDYLFPDTYEFYTGSSGETVIRKFLDNFDAKLDAEVKAMLKNADMTLDDAINLASIIQGEAANEREMPKVSRVLHNRLDNPSAYPRLECDATGKYAASLIPQIDGVEISGSGYDTYKRNGLPVGPINNPGIAAIKAALNPSEDATVRNCYFFANDSEGNTYYSKTYAEHVKVCRAHGIGIHKR